MNFQNEVSNKVRTLYLVMSPKSLNLKQSSSPSFKNLIQLTGNWVRSPAECDILWVFQFDFFEVSLNLFYQEIFCKLEVSSKDLNKFRLTVLLYLLQPRTVRLCCVFIWHHGGGTEPVSMVIQTDVGSDGDRLTHSIPESPVRLLPNTFIL